MIEMEHISLYTASTGRSILNDISWRIGSGERWVLFGRNGAGKTRLLEIIAGYNFPSAGSIRRFGKGPLGTDIRELRKRIGYHSTLIEHRFPESDSALDVVLSGCHATIGLFSDPSDGEIHRARALLASVGLETRAGDRFSVLSDGERQKALLARAFIARPDLLILDEPATHLDLAAREDMLEALSGLAESSNAGILYVTHRTEEIIPAFGRLFIIHEGTCCFQGGIDEGLTTARLGGIFGRSVRIERMGGRFYTLLE